MFKKTLITVAALSTLALGATAANAHGYGYGYGHDHHYSNGYSYDYTDYQPSCYTESRPVTIQVWDDYSCEYVFKTIYRDYNVCQ